MNNKKKKIIILIIFVITGIVIGCVLIKPKEYVNETDNIKEVKPSEENIAEETDKPIVDKEESNTENNNNNNNNNNNSYF